MFKSIVLRATLLVSFLSKSVSPTQYKCTDIGFCSQNQPLEIVTNATGAYYKQRNREKTVGERTNWSGFRPKRYNLLLSFKNNNANYHGSVDIVGELIEKTRLIKVNIDFDYVTYNHSTVSISCCSSWQPGQICIERVVEYTKFQYVTLKLNDTLREDKNCIVRFPYFESSSARTAESNRSAVGLRMSGGQNFSAVTTDFKMRYARTVFPCLDHPSLKARFSLMLRYPIGHSVVSNSPSKLPAPIALTNNNETLMDSFELTMPISTHSFGFAVLKGYKIYKDLSQPLFRLAIPESIADRFDWITKSVFEIGLYMTQTADVTPPPNFLTVIIVSSTTPLAVNGYGLVFLNASSLEKSPENILYEVVLYEALIRQWIGGTFSVPQWNEICLEEGLMQYFLWFFRSKEPSAFGQWSSVESLERVSRNRTVPLVDTNDDVQRLDIGQCQLQAGAFFGNLASLFGHKIMEHLLTGLITDFPFGVVGLNRWDDEVARFIDKNRTLKTYTENFIRQSKPLELVVELDRRLSILEINIGEISSLPIPLKIYRSSSPSPTIVVLTTHQFQDFLSENDTWVLVDPDGETWTRKFYDPETFSQLQHHQPIDIHHHLTEQRKQTLLQDFCHGFLGGYLSYDENSDTWKDLARNLYNFNVSCRCCLLSVYYLTNCTYTDYIACQKLSKVTKQ